MSVDGQADALAALARLHARGIVTLEEAQAAARLLAGDAAFVFPPPPGEASATPQGTPPGPEAEQGL